MIARTADRFLTLLHSPTRHRFKAYFIFAALMFLFIALFMVLVRNYKYSTPAARISNEHIQLLDEADGEHRGHGGDDSGDVECEMLPTPAKTDGDDVDESTSLLAKSSPIVRTESGRENVFA